MGAGLVCKSYANLSFESRRFGHDKLRVCEGVDQGSDACLSSQLRAAGCAKVFAETISGAKSDRPELAKVFAVLHGR